MPGLAGLPLLLKASARRAAAAWPGQLRRLRRRRAPAAAAPRAPASAAGGQRCSAHDAQRAPREGKPTCPLLLSPLMLGGLTTRTPWHSLCYPPKAAAFLTCILTPVIACQVVVVPVSYSRSTLLFMPLTALTMRCKMHGICFSVYSQQCWARCCVWRLQRPLQPHRHGLAESFILWVMRGHGVQVIDDVASMGFSRHEVHGVISDLMDNGQSVDLNIVLDRLMRSRA